MQDSGLLIGVFSLQGKRPYQEDDYAVSSTTIVAAILKIASKLRIEKISPN